MLERFAEGAEALIDRIGRVAAWLVLAVVFFLFVQNPLRQYLGHGQFVANDLGQLCHATVFMLGVAYAWRWDRQVRVDLLYGRMSPKARAWVNLLGTLLLLLPWLALVGWDAVPTAIDSIKMRESFPESGSPGFFLMKSVVVLFVGTMALQAAAVIARSLAVLFGPRTTA